jgi:hypothetical protein
MISRIKNEDLPNRKSSFETRKLKMTIYTNRKSSFVNRNFLNYFLFFH